MLPSFDVLPTKNPEMRRMFMYLGTGKTMDMNWFLPLQADVVHVDHDPSPLPVVPEYDGVHLPVVDSVSHDPPVVVSEDEVQMKLQSVMDKLRDKLAARIGHDPAGYEKAIAVLEKSVDKLPATVDSALQKTLYSFGKSVTEVRLFYL